MTATFDPALPFLTMTINLAGDAGGEVGADNNRCQNYDSCWMITGPLTLNLRAERSGTGSGRVYTIIVSCTDDAGNTSTRATQVLVPHDKGK